VKGGGGGGGNCEKRGEGMGESIVTEMRRYDQEPSNGKRPNTTRGQGGKASRTKEKRRRPWRKTSEGKKGKASPFGVVSGRGTRKGKGRRGVTPSL